MSLVPRSDARVPRTGMQLAIAFAFRRIQIAYAQRCYIEVAAICESVICDRLRAAFRGKLIWKPGANGAPYAHLAKLGREESEWVPLIRRINRWYKRRSDVVHGIVISVPRTRSPREFMCLARATADEGIELARCVRDLQRKNSAAKN